MSMVVTMYGDLLMLLKKRFLQPMRIGCRIEQ